jgi:hypothetical protein
MLQEGATATMEAWTTDEKPNLSWSELRALILFGGADVELYTTDMNCV